ncbi:GDA1/CD39 (nucleoside phosphatase) family protein [Besnoitia besnoiti]|uniref:GDA1/CD39 (Nucleoside phosphatase) family protein n=1 Tax=Besnoitia besnoiti TaxID=94643 RepID=A0A2A9MK75_BESBE|nr:GDA1/CD39 (nucleoside phosphatase) family protein [Besnoitia besnoiti]PFH37604.1 GDA1/CD39 (nucleoside phosphatase) family protein [Besnoitia besnoiti]
MSGGDRVAAIHTRARLEDARDDGAARHGLASSSSPRVSPHFSSPSTALLARWCSPDAVHVEPSHPSRWTNSVEECGDAAVPGPPTYRLLDVDAAATNARPSLLSARTSGRCSAAHLRHGMPESYFEAPSQGSFHRATSSNILDMRCGAFWKEAFWWVLAPLLFLFLWLVWSATTSIYSSEQSRVDYGIVIDAGSHGTRLTVFRWPARRFDPRHPLTGPVTIPQAVCDATPGPELSNFTDGFSDARRLFKSMLDEAQLCLTRRSVPVSSWGEVPLFVKATGGMRNLSQATRDAVMANLREALMDPTLNPFRFHPAWARVISGEEEGIYGWLAVNSVRGSLSADPEKTVGALDMGGASTQITFSPVHTSVLEDFNAVHLGDTSIHLYSHSYLGYGWSDSLNRVSTILGAETLLQRLREDPEFVRSALKKAQAGRASGPDSSLASSVRRTAVGLTGESRRPQANAGDHRPLSRRREKEDAEQQLHLAAVHPCLPRGSVRSFQMPSLAYPERRFYADMNIGQIAAFMKAAAYTKNDIMKTVKSMAPYGVEMRHALQDMQPLSRTPSAAVSFAAGGTSDQTPPDVDAAGRSESAKPPSQVHEETGTEGADTRKSLPRHRRSAADEEKTGPEEGEHGKGMQREETPEDAGRKKAADSGREGSQEADAKLQEYEDAADRGTQGGVEVTLDVKPRVAFVIRFVGSGDFETCRNIAYKLFHNSLCFINSCSFNGVYQPRLEDSKFIAFGQYSKIHGVLGLDNPPTLSQFLESTVAICGHRLKRLKAMRKRGSFRAYGDSSLHKLCWKAVWSFAVLRQGFGFPLESSQIFFASLNSTDGENDYATPGWALGSMISEVNYFPWQAPVEQYHGLFHLAAAFLLMSIILAIILYHEVSYLRKRLQRAEQSAVYETVLTAADSPHSMGAQHRIDCAPP